MASYGIKSSLSRTSSHTEGLGADERSWPAVVGQPKMQLTPVVLGRGDKYGLEMALGPGPQLYYWKWQRATGRRLTSTTHYCRPPVPYNAKYNMSTTIKKELKRGKLSESMAEIGTRHPEYPHTFALSLSLALGLSVTRASARVSQARLTYSFTMRVLLKY